MRGALMAGLLLATACSDDIEAGMHSANDLMYRQNYVEAERLYRKLLKRLEASGRDGEAADTVRLALLDRLGKINALYLRDYTQAIADYEGLIRRYPKTDQALSALANVADLYHYKLANLRQAVDSYQRLVEQFSSRPEARHAQLEIVTAYFKLKDYEQARLEGEALRQRWPGTVEAAQAQFQIADAYYVQKRYTEAIASYEMLLGKDQDPSLTSLVLFELGTCYQELGDSERALIYYYACLAQHPNPTLVQRKIARVRARLHRTAPQASIMNARAVVPPSTRRTTKVLLPVEKSPQEPTESVSPESPADAR